jgi:hypothetical protein
MRFRKVRAPGSLRDAISFSPRPGQPPGFKSHHTMADPGEAAWAAGAGSLGADAVQAGAHARSGPGSQADAAAGPRAPAVPARAAPGGSAGGGRVDAVGSEARSTGSCRARVGPCKQTPGCAGGGSARAASGTVARVFAGATVLANGT